MWKSVKAIVQGSSHINSNIPCQDYTTSKNDGEVAVIVLADGAGSVKHSEMGARIACETIISFICGKFDVIYNGDAIQIKMNLIHRIRTRLGIAAKKYNSNKEDFASTLLFVAVKNDMFFCGHLGDGVIGIIDNDNQTKVLSFPECGEFANSTFFTTSKKYKHHLRLIKGKTFNIKSFFIMSDGAADCLFQKETNNFAKAILLFSSWVEQYDINDVNKAIEDNMRNMFLQYTTDDCSFNLLQRTKSKK